MFFHRSIPDSKTGPSCGRITDDYHNILGTTQERCMGCKQQTVAQRRVKTEVHTHRSRGNRASCTWCDAGLGSHWSPGKNMAWEGWIEAREGSCFLGDKSKVGASTRKHPQWVSWRNQVKALLWAWIQGALIQVCFRSAPRVWGKSSPAMATEGSLLPLADSYTDFRIRRLKSNCRERTEVTLPLSSHSTGHNRPQAPPGLHQRQGRP